MNRNQPDINVEYAKRDKILLAILLIYPLLMIWQGLDFTDTGYSLVNYQQIFNDPESIQYGGLIFWLTNIIGGTWWLLVGQHLGLIGMRLGGVLVMYLTMFITYKTLSEYIKKEYILLGLFFALIYNGRIWGITYDTLTALFYVSAAYFLQKGILRNNIACLFIAAFILGLNIFVRVPNLLGFGLIVTLFFCAYLEKIPSSKVIKQSLFFTGGFLLAIASVVLVMYYIGHLNLWLTALQNLLGQGADTNSKHGLISLVGTVLDTHLLILIFLGFTIYIMFVMLFFFNKHKTNLTFKNVSFLFLVFTITELMPLRVISNYLFYYICIGSGICYVCLLISILNRKFPFSHRVLASIALFIIFMTPLGSDLGTMNSIFGMWLAFPISISYIAGINNSNFTFPWPKKPLTFSFSSKDLDNIRSFILAAGLSILLIITYSFTYRDAFNRLAMHHTIEHPYLFGVYTTKQRAEVVQELIDASSQFVKKDDYLLAYNQIPMIYFITETRPYLYSSWPLFIQYDTFNALLNKRQAEKTKLPVIIRATGSTVRYEWPISSEPTPTNKHELLDQFLKEKEYSSVWENEYFEILVTNKSQ